MTSETGLETRIWRSEQLRLTAMLSATPPTAIFRDWWPALIGTSPDEFRETPRIAEMRGAYADGVLRMCLELPLRIDILFGPPDLSDPEMLTPFDDALTPFVDLTTRWFRLLTRPAVQRLGVGVNVIQVFPKIEDCRTALDSYLPAVDMRRSGLLDFQYKINRPTSSALDELTLNRIGAWSADPFRVANDELRHGVRLAADANTAFSESDHRNLDDRVLDLAELFVELTSHCIHLVREGDRP